MLSNTAFKQLPEKNGDGTVTGRLHLEGKGNNAIRGKLVQTSSYKLFLTENKIRNN